MCVPHFQMLTGCLIYLWFFSPLLHLFFPTMPTGKTDSPKSIRVCVCVSVCMHASVNPFCQVLAQPFLSKLPAWSWSPLCWWEELKEKAYGTPAAPRPGLGPSAHEGRSWDLLRAGALCGSCDWRFNRLSLGHPSATLHSLSHLGNGGKKTITHIFSNLPLPVFPQSCISDVRPFTRSIKKLSKVSVFCKWVLLNNLQISLDVWTACLQFYYAFALVYLIFFSE